MGIEIPKIELRFEHLWVEGDVYAGSRALPTLLNATLNAVEVIFSIDIFVLTSEYESSPEGQFVFREGK